MYTSTRIVDTKIYTCICVWSGTKMRRAGNYVTTFNLFEFTNSNIKYSDEANEIFNFLNNEYTRIHSYMIIFQNRYLSSGFSILKT